MQHTLSLLTEDDTGLIVDNHPAYPLFQFKKKDFQYESGKIRMVKKAIAQGFFRAFLGGDSPEVESVTLEGVEQVIKVQMNTVTEEGVEQAMKTSAAVDAPADRKKSTRNTIRKQKKAANVAKKKGKKKVFGIKVGHDPGEEVAIKQPASLANAHLFDDPSNPTVFVQVKRSEFRRTGYVTIEADANQNQGLYSTSLVDSLAICIGNDKSQTGNPLVAKNGVCISKSKLIKMRSDNMPSNWKDQDEGCSVEDVMGCASKLGYGLTLRSYGGTYDESKRPRNSLSILNGL